MALPARLLSILMLVLLGACSTSESAQVPSSDTDAYDDQIAEINNAWEEFRVAGNACVGADGSCWTAALASSGFEQAASDLRATAKGIEDTVETGECRSSFAALGTELEHLLDSIDALKDDVEAADASGIESSAPAVRSAWEAAVTAQGSTEVCFPEGLVTTTAR
jgi:hypothetical protein